MVIQPQFDEVRSFSEGLAKIKIDGKFGYINTNGQIVIQPRFEESSDFQDGLAAIKKVISGDTLIKGIMWLFSLDLTLQMISTWAWLE